MSEVSDTVPVRPLRGIFLPPCGGPVESSDLCPDEGENHKSSFTRSVREPTGGDGDGTHLSLTVPIRRNKDGG